MYVEEILSRAKINKWQKNLINTTKILNTFKRKRVDIVFTKRDTKKLKTILEKLTRKIKKTNLKFKKNVTIWPLKVCEVSSAWVAKSSRVKSKTWRKSLLNFSHVRSYLYIVSILVNSILLRINDHFLT